MAESSTTAAQAFKLAMVQAMQRLTAEDKDVLVTFGYAGQEGLNFRDLVSFEDVASDQDPATLGTNRAREEVLTLKVAVECYRPGGIDQEIVASGAAYDLLGRLERYVRVTDTTLGGTVRQCFLSSHTSTGETDPAALAQLAGRIVLVEALFTARVRITG